MQRIRIGLLCPALRALSNYIDKYLLSNIFHEEKNLSVLLIFSSIVGVIVIPFALFFSDNIFAISNINKVLMILGGMIYVISIIPYLYALKKDDTSTIVPLFQMIAPISLLLGYILFNETLNIQQLIGFFIIFIASFLLSLDIRHKTTFKYKGFLLMLLSCLLISFKYIIFKRVNIETSFRTTAFWEYIGFIIISILLLLIPGYAKSFIHLFKNNKTKIIGLNAITEISNIIAIIIMSYISTITFIGFAQLMNGMQGVFVFLYGIILTLIFPKIIKETYSTIIVIQKVVCFSLIIFGLYLL